jgi:hypothetical protein
MWESKINALYGDYICLSSSVCLSVCDLISAPKELEDRLKIDMRYFN